MWHVARMATVSTAIKVRQSVLAAELGCDRTHVSKLLSGKRQASLAQAIVIFRMTKKKVGELAGTTDRDAAKIASILAETISA